MTSGVFVDTLSISKISFLFARAVPGGEIEVINGSGN